MPEGPIGKFRHEKILKKSKCSPGSYRTIVRGKHRILVCCPLGEFDAKHRICKVGTVAKSILHPKTERLFSKNIKRGKP